MAALTVAAARAAREEAERLRVDASALRLAAQRGHVLATARKKRAKAAAATAARMGRLAPPASPWSPLVWLREDVELDRVLVALD